jgi:hypothetical protein
LVYNLGTMANNGGNKRSLEQDGDDEAPDAKRIRDNDGKVILVQVSPDAQLEPIPKRGELKPPRPIKALPQKRLRGLIKPRNPEPKAVPGMPPPGTTTGGSMPIPVPQEPGAQNLNPELQTPNTAPKHKATAEPLIAWKPNRNFRTQKASRYPSPRARQKSINRDPVWGAGEPKGLPSRATPAEEAAGSQANLSGKLVSAMPGAARKF